MGLQCHPGAAPVIRPATAGDAAALAALSIEVWLSTYIRRGITPLYADYALATFTTDAFRAALSDRFCDLLVSQNAEGIDGYLRLGHANPSPLKGGGRSELVTLYVQPRHQGRGIGRALLVAARRVCAARGVREAWLAVNAENRDAIGFYRRLGLPEAGQTTFDIGDERHLNIVLTWDPGAL